MAKGSNRATSNYGFQQRNFTVRLKIDITILNHFKREIKKQFRTKSEDFASSVYTTYHDDY